MADKLSKKLPRPQQQAASRAKPGDSIAVLGLGRFGSAVASELTRLGHDVLGIDENEEPVANYATKITHAVQADITNTEALLQLGLDDVSHAVVAVSSDLEASILATAALSELGVKVIWAKATSKHHGRILQQVGAHHVVYPEHDMGHQVAHMVGGRILDWIQLDDDFALVETVVPSELVGKKLAEVDIHKTHNVSIVCVKSGNKTYAYATGDTVLGSDDLLVVAGFTEAAEAFARLA